MISNHIEAWQSPQNHAHVILNIFNNIHLQFLAQIHSGTLSKPGPKSMLHLWKLSSWKPQCLNFKNSHVGHPSNGRVTGPRKKMELRFLWSILCFACKMEIKVVTFLLSSGTILSLSPKNLGSFDHLPPTPPLPLAIWTPLWCKTKKKAGFFLKDVDVQQNLLYHGIFIVAEYHSYIISMIWVWPPHCNSGKWRFIGIPY